MKETRYIAWLSASAPARPRCKPNFKSIKHQKAHKLLEFITRSDSGGLPGAAPMLGARTVAQGGVTAGMAVANVTVSGVKTYKSNVARMAAASGRSSGTLFIGVFCQTGLDQTGPDAQGEGWFTDASDECE